MGLSVEWHEFVVENGLWWGGSVHPGSLEICINFSGRASLDGEAGILPGSVSYYTQAMRSAERAAGEPHRFLTIEMSRDWLRQALGTSVRECPSGVRSFLEKKRGGRSAVRPLTGAVRQAAEEMLNPPPVLGAVWYPAKVMEIAAHAFAPGELFCERHKRVAAERVAMVRQILARDLEYPPTLGELAREVGCSPFHLSRIFSEEAGVTITRYLRTLRLERAAELLRTGKHNVTEAAMMVGYSSLSHFSKAFAEQFGHCPCVFPLRRSGPKT